MKRRLAEIVASALVAAVAGYTLWPPRMVYWTAVAAVVGEVVTMAVVFVVAALVGAAVARFSDVAISSLAIGGAAAYVLGMTVVESTMTPDSPVHLYLYGAFLVCGLFGALATRRYLGSDGRHGPVTTSA